MRLWELSIGALLFDGGAVATLELPTDGDRPEALPAAPDVENTSFGRR